MKLTMGTRLTADLVYALRLRHRDTYYMYIRHVSVCHGIIIRLLKWYSALSLRIDNRLEQRLETKTTGEPRLLKR